MPIYVRGLNKKISRVELKYATRWMLDFLIGKRLARNVLVIIESIGVPKDEPELKGDIVHLDDRYRPREFRIRLVKVYSRLFQLKTLFHELVHLKQIALGEMAAWSTGTHTRWKNRFIDESEKEHRDLPWEREAYAKEDKLFKKYRKHIKEYGLKF